MGLHMTIEAPAGIDRSFAPDGARGRTIDAAMHLELARSIEYLVEQCQGRVDFDPAAAGDLVRRLDGGARLPPVGFARYYELVFSLLANELDEAATRWRNLVATGDASPGLRVVPLEDPSESELGALYTRLMSGDGSDGASILPPPPDVMQDFERRFRDGLDLMKRADGALAEEFLAIIREVVCVVGNPSRKTQLDGSSHYQLWGALFINAEFHDTPEAMMEVLAHESGHSLLFGFCTHEPLVYNDDEPRYASPLRRDPRPMDGIYHATFVSARMHLAMERLLASGLVEASRRPTVREAMHADAKNFRDGDAVVRASADLSPLGRALIDNARAYLDGALTR